MKAHLLKTIVTFAFILVCLSISATETNYPMELSAGCVNSFFLQNGVDSQQATHKITSLLGWYLEANILPNADISKLFTLEESLRLLTKGFGIETKDDENNWQHESYVTNTYLGVTLRLKVNATKYFHPYAGCGFLRLCSQNNSANTSGIISDDRELGLLVGFDLDWSFFEDKLWDRYGLKFEYQHTIKGDTVKINNKKFSNGSLIVAVRYSF